MARPRSRRSTTRPEAPEPGPRAARVRSGRPPEGVRLGWPGRTWEPAPPRQGRLVPRIETRELAPSASADARLVLGDALDVAGALGREGLSGQVRLVYVDPPFASQAQYVQEARLDGPADGRVVRSAAFEDRWGAAGIGAYLDMLAPRLGALAGLLAANGTIWVHVDWRASYLVRVLLDEILGREAFLNEIVWKRAPNLGRQAASQQFGRTLDTLVVYGNPEATLSPPTRLEPIEPGAIRTDEQGRPFTTAPRGDYTDASIARLDAEGRVLWSSSGKAYVKYFLVRDDQGTWCRERRVDALWTDVAPLRHAKPSERTGFPTQKPRALLDRIVACSTAPGDLVVDLFSGSGTTGESAHAQGRRFVLGDASVTSGATARARLLRAGVPLTVQSCGVEWGKADAPRFEVEPRGERRALVRLLAPAEPLAWAIDASYDPGRPWGTAYHSERTPGTRAQPAAREAEIARTRDGRIAVRAWNDDGTAGTALEGSSA